MNPVSAECEFDDPSISDQSSPIRRRRASTHHTAAKYDGASSSEEEDINFSTDSENECTPVSKVPEMPNHLFTVAMARGKRQVLDTFKKSLGKPRYATGPGIYSVDFDDWEKYEVEERRLMEIEDAYCHRAWKFQKKKILEEQIEQLKQIKLRRSQSIEYKIIEQQRLLETERRNDPEGMERIAKENYDMKAEDEICKARKKYDEMIIQNEIRKRKQQKQLEAFMEKKKILIRKKAKEDYLSQKHEILRSRNECLLMYEEDKLSAMLEISIDRAMNERVYMDNLLQTFIPFFTPKDVSVPISFQNSTITRQKQMKRIKLPKLEQFNVQFPNQQYSPKRLSNAAPSSIVNSSEALLQSSPSSLLKISLHGKHFPKHEVSHSPLTCTRENSVSSASTIGGDLMDMSPITCSSEYSISPGSVIGDNFMDRNLDDERLYELLSSCNVTGCEYIRSHTRGTSTSLRNNPYVNSSKASTITSIDPYVNSSKASTVTSIMTPLSQGVQERHDGFKHLKTLQLDPKRRSPTPIIREKFSYEKVGRDKGQNSRDLNGYQYQGVQTSGTHQTSIASSMAQIYALDLSFHHNFLSLGMLEIQTNRYCMLRVLDVSYCEALVDISSISHCTELQTLLLSGCKKIRNISAIGCLPSLMTLDIGGCVLISSVSCLRNCLSLQILNLSDCASLRSLIGLSDCLALHTLFLSNCMIKSVDTLSRCPALKILDLRGCSRIKDFSPLSRCKHLMRLNLSLCKELKDVSSLVQSGDSGVATSLNNSLYSLDLSGCLKFQEVNILSHFVGLRIIDMSNCESLQQLPPLRYCASLYTVNFAGCKNILTAGDLGACPSLGRINFNECHSLVDISALSGSSSLFLLELAYCSNLVDICMLSSSILNLYFFFVRNSVPNDFKCLKYFFTKHLCLKLVIIFIH